MSVMTSYNRINGPFAADSAELINGVLRDEWGFDGLVMSDWFGLHSTVEGDRRPGSISRCPDRPATAVQQLRRRRRRAARSMPPTRAPAAGNVLRLMHRLGRFDDGEPGPETTGTAADDRALSARPPRPGMVLLRNEPRPAPRRCRSPRRSPGRRHRPERRRRPDHGRRQRPRRRRPSVSHPLGALRSRLGPPASRSCTAPGCDIYKTAAGRRAATVTPIAARLLRRPGRCRRAARSARSTRGDGDIAADVVHATRSSVRRRPQRSARGRTTTFTPDVSGAVEVLGVDLVAPTPAVRSTATRCSTTPAQPIGGSFFGMGKAEMHGCRRLDSRADVPARGRDASAPDRQCHERRSTSAPSPRSATT